MECVYLFVLRHFRRIFNCLLVCDFFTKMEFENNPWVNVLKSAHKTSLTQDGTFKQLYT